MYRTEKMKKGVSNYDFLNLMEITSKLNHIFVQVLMLHLLFVHIQEPSQKLRNVYIP